MFEYPFNRDALFCEYRQKEGDVDPFYFVADSDEKTIYLLTSKTNGVWLRVDKIRRYKSKAKVYGEFWHFGKVWDGNYDFDLTDDFQRKIFESIESFLKRFRNL